jgi:hypothetical protein
VSFLITRGFESKHVISRGFGFSLYVAIHTVIGDVIFRRVKPTQIFSRAYMDRVFKRDATD